MIKADLHLHTNFSDGNLSPGQLINLSSEAGLSIISITDHDNVYALKAAIDRGKEKGIQVIPGVEFSVDINDTEIHILGYFIDYKNSYLLDYLNSLRKKRIARIKKIIEKLNSLGSKIKFSSLEGSLTPDISIGRPHIAMNLYKNGFVNSYYEAFVKYLGDDKPAYVKKPNPQAGEIINLISNLGGLSFIAHPGKLVRNELLNELIQSGIDGIETIHPSHSKEDTEYFNKIASDHFLLTSGGSDFHGGLKNDMKNFGNYYVSINEIINMKRRLFY